MLSRDGHPTLLWEAIAHYGRIEKTLVDTGDRRQFLRLVLGGSDRPHVGTPEHEGCLLRRPASTTRSPGRSHPHAGDLLFCTCW